MTAIAETLFFILDILGTVAFAVSGTIVALEKRTDIFGVVLLGCTTALGGGIFRDMILGNLPPRIFTYYTDAIIALAVSLLVFLVAALKKDRFRSNEPLINAVVNIFDAVGLGVFVVTGMGIAINLGYYDNIGLTVFAGVITAIGGGLLRDIMIDEMPFVLKKRVYAIAAIAGGIIYYFLLPPAGSTIASLCGIVSTFAIRILATWFRWNLPKAF